MYLEGITFITKTSKERLTDIGLRRVRGQVVVWTRVGRCKHQVSVRDVGTHGKHFPELFFLVVLNNTQGIDLEVAIANLANSGHSLPPEGGQSGNFNPVLIFSEASNCQNLGRCSHTAPPVRQIHISRCIELCVWPVTQFGLVWL